MSSEATTSVIVLLEELTGEARIQMRDGDNFYVAVADAARACRRVDDLRHFGSQLTTLIEILKAWTVPRQQQIKGAYLTSREHGLLFLVVQKEREVDASLSDALTELDLELANDPRLNQIELDVLAIPNVSTESTKAFLSSGPVYTAYAK